MLGLGAGGGLIVIAFVAQYLIKKRLSNPKIKQLYMWTAWICACTPASSTCCLVRTAPARPPRCTW